VGKRKSSEEKRKHIRHSAYICFRESGYYQSSIDDICSAANISKGSFYWHYGAKLDVFIDILESWAREVIDELLEQFEMATRSPDRIALLGQAFEAEFHRARAIVPLWAEFSLLGRTDKEIQMSIGKFFRRARAAIAEILRHTTDEQLSEDEIGAASSMILGAYIGVILQEFADPSTNAAEWARNFMSILRSIFHQKMEKPIKSSSKTGLRVSNSKLKTVLTKVSASQRKMVNKLRDLIFSIQEDVDERWVQGWKVFGYYKKGLNCHIKVKDEAIEVTFYHGSSLPDPDGLLLGLGKRRRSVLITDGLLPDALIGFFTDSLNGYPK
jgi:AcrR family transcriptional regulator